MKPLHFFVATVLLAGVIALLVALTPVHADGGHVLAAGPLAIGSAPAGGFINQSFCTFGNLGPRTVRFHTKLLLDQGGNNLATSDTCGEALAPGDSCSIGTDAVAAGVAVLCVYAVQGSASASGVLDTRRTREFPFPLTIVEQAIPLRAVLGDN